MKIILRRTSIPFYRLYQRLYTSWLNERSLLQSVTSICINGSFIFAWVLLAESSKQVPKRYKPNIHVKLDMRLDEYMFSSIFGSMLTIYCLMAGSWLLYLKFYSPRQLHRYSEGGISPVNSPGSDISRNSDLEDKHDTLELADLNKLGANTYINERLLERINKQKDHKNLNYGHLSPPILCALSWFLLNFLCHFKDSNNPIKFVLAWLFYVVLYFVVPLITGYWLYLFHPPGALRLYTFGLGIQNIFSVITHVIFPNAPPLYIHYFGENKKADYDMIFADGLSKPGTRLPTSFYESVYYVNSNKFASIPSIHSTTAVMTFLFISYYSRKSILKFLSFTYLLFEWWSTLYLEHHYRLDLLIGLLYSICTYTFLIHWKKGFSKIDQDFIRARLKFDFIRGSTMGMRIFQNTRFQKFFDPLH